MADDIFDFVNHNVYRKVAKMNDVEFNVVETIMDYVSETIAGVIVEDNPKVSVKLDFMGNFFSKPGRRKKIEEKRREKENNGFTTDGGGRDNLQSIRT